MSTVRERPIPFTGPMVRAILEGRKTVTRRVVKFAPDSGYIVETGGKRRWHRDDPEAVQGCPYGKPGERLWVKETWAPHCEQCLNARDKTGLYFRADDATDYETDGRWRSSRFMPRWASRILLDIEDVRVQRLQDISEEDAEAEGDPQRGLIASENTHVEWFRALWDSINARKAPWASNPFVWAITFRRLP